MDALTQFSNQEYNKLYDSLHFYIDTSSTYFFSTRSNDMFDVLAAIKNSYFYYLQSPANYASYIRDYVFNASCPTLGNQLTIAMNALFNETDTHYIGIRTIEEQSNFNYFAGTTINKDGVKFYHNYDGEHESLYKDQVFQRILEIPPVNLVQDYVTCYPQKSAAIINNFGVALSNTGICAYLFFSIMIFITIKVINGTSKAKREPFILHKRRKNLYVNLTLKTILETLSKNENINNEDRNKCTSLLKCLISSHIIDETEEFNHTEHFLFDDILHRNDDATESDAGVELSDTRRVYPSG